VIKMTVLPSQIHSMIKLYTKFSRDEKNPFEQPEVNLISEPEDRVQISTEAKKKQIQEQAKTEVMKKIKESFYG